MVLSVKMNLPTPLQRVVYSIYERRLARELSNKPRPKHVAVMADGNRRWAREAGFEDVSHGHRVGSRKIAEFVGWCAEQNIELVTLYLLSTENLGRDPEELDLLLDIITDVVDELAQSPQGIRLRMVGHLELLPEKMAERLRADEALTAENSGVEVNIAVGYGGRQEIVDAVRKVIRAASHTGIPAAEMEQEITTEAISQQLLHQGAA